MGATAFAIDGSIPALPATASFFGVEIGRVQLTISMYILGFGLGQIPMGVLCDQYGRRPIVLICMTIFAVLGVVSTLSINVEMLVTARFFQGFFAASGAVIARAIVRDITSGAETGRLLSLMTSTHGLVMIVAPVIGALLLALLSWRATFLASAVFGAIGVALMYYTIPETLKEKPSGRAIDKFIHGLQLFMASIVSVFGAVLVGLTFSALITVVTLSSEVFVQSFGFTELEYAICFSLASIGFVSGGLANRRFLTQYSEQIILRWIAIGFVFCAIGLLFNLLIVTHKVFLLIALIVCLFFCISATLALATTIALKPLAKTAGMAAAILGTVQLSFGGLCSTILTFVNLEAVALLHTVLIAVSVAIIVLIVVGTGRLMQD
jgi:DHA1 family bicyclomycin/chloramphenicol resistance-like MFS transporter